MIIREKYIAKIRPFYESDLIKITSDTIKNNYYTTPENMKGLESWGFNWLEYVTSISSPMPSAMHEVYQKIFKEWSRKILMKIITAKSAIW